MLIRPELIDALAETLEGLAVSAPNGVAESEESNTRIESSILLFHPRSNTTGNEKQGRLQETPLLEINFFESDERTMIIVHSALGMVEMHGVEEVRLLEATREAAFLARGASGKTSMLTVSAQGVLQVYSNISQEIEGKELEDLSEEDLRAAVALKVFLGNARVFTSTEAAANS